MEVIQIQDRSVYSKVPLEVLGFKLYILKELKILGLISYYGLVHSLRSDNGIQETRRQVSNDVSRS